MTDQLEYFPESGRIIPEIKNKNCREIIMVRIGLCIVLLNENLDYCVIHGAVIGIQVCRKE